MRAAVIGVGAVGARCARQLVSSDEVASVVVRDPILQRAQDVVASLGERAELDEGDMDAAVDADVVVLAGPADSQPAAAAAHLRAGRSVVCTTDDAEDIEALVALDAEARERGASVVVGAGFAPGLTDVLARHAASRLDSVDEIHVAKSGTGGPECARVHHRALGSTAIDWRDGGWVRRPAGSGRELCWFPDPIGPRDCYRAGLGDALLLVPAFPGVVRVTARSAANRRDRLTARLPMLRPPHPEGGPGGIRVEVRGQRDEGHDVVVFGAMDRPAVAAGAVAALAARWIATGRMARSGAAGLAELVEPIPFLTELRERGVRCAVFEGDGAGVR